MNQERWIKEFWVPFAEKRPVSMLLISKRIEGI